MGLLQDKSLKKVCVTPSSTSEWLLLEARYWCCNDGLAVQDIRALTIGLDSASNPRFVWVWRIQLDSNVMQIEVLEQLRFAEDHTLCVGRGKHY